MDLFASHPGEAVNITCVACFGTRPQFFMFLLWQVNGTNVNDMGVARFQEEQEEIQRYFCVKAKHSPSLPDNGHLQRKHSV